jgi:hypothetical protein
VGSVIVVIEGRGGRGGLPLLCGSRGVLLRLLEALINEVERLLEVAIYLLP